MIAEIDRPRTSSRPACRHAATSLPPEDVHNTELLGESGTKTLCPYRDIASHWSVEVSGERVEDAA